MRKSILLSIQPQWMEKILNGDKTVERRKTKPSCELPIDVFLHCTKKPPYLIRPLLKPFKWFVSKTWPNYFHGNGKVVAKFTLNTVSTFGEDIEGKSNYVYAWHIDNLVIFDEPKALSEFMTASRKPTGQGDLFKGMFYKPSM